MAKKKAGPIPRLRVRRGATRREIYAAAKRWVTAEELQKYTVIEPMYPAEQLLAELEEIERNHSKKKKKRT